MVKADGKPVRPQIPHSLVHEHFVAIRVKQAEPAATSELVELVNSHLWKTDGEGNHITKVRVEETGRAGGM